MQYSGVLLRRVSRYRSLTMTNNTARKLEADLPDLEAYWMPFTGNRYFKQNPRMISRAEGMYCYTHEGQKLLDAVAGLWCCNAGHCHPKVVEAIKAQAETLDYETKSHKRDTGPVPCKLGPLCCKEYTRIVQVGHGFAP